MIFGSIPDSCWKLPIIPAVASFEYPIPVKKSHTARLVFGEPDISTVPPVIVPVVSAGAALAYMSTSLPLNMDAIKLLPMLPNLAKTPICSTPDG